VHCSGARPAEAPVQPAAAASSRSPITSTSFATSRCRGGRRRPPCLQQVQRTEEQKRNHLGLALDLVALVVRLLGDRLVVGDPTTNNSG
jgi:hypothetical protein